MDTDRHQGDETVQSSRNPLGESENKVFQLNPIYQKTSIAEIQTPTDNWHGMEQAGATARPYIGTTSKSSSQIFQSSIN